VLECNTFAITEHKRVLSSVHRHDIKNGETGEVVGTAVELIGRLSRILRWVLGRRLLPTTVEAREKPDDSLVFTIHRSAYLFRARVEVRDAQDQLVGYFTSEFLPVGGHLRVYDQDDKYFASVRGNLFGSSYRFLSADGTVQLGEVTKTRGGLAGGARGALFSADNYFLMVNPDLSELPLAKMLILAAALAVDIIYKSESRGD
jgi:hypothetical protein